MKQAVIYGSGSIGRGFIGQLFSESGYEISFIDVNKDVIDRLNVEGSYRIYVADGDHYDIHTVAGVRGIDGNDTEQIAKVIASVEIMATAVGVNVLKHIAEPVALGIRRRMELGLSAPLNIILCENRIDADRFFAAQVKEHLNDKERAYFDAHVGLIEPSIGRMVPATPPEISANDPLAVCAEPYCELPVDGAAFKGRVPEIHNMIPFSPFDFYIRRKLYLHNMSHALTAYLGNLKGYEYIWQANVDYSIRRITRDALEEISWAMAKEYKVSYSELEIFSYDLILRYDNRLLGDTVERVGKDTKRKLSESDRFVGAIRLCLKHGIVPANIIKGLAAGFLFCPEGDQASLEVVGYLMENGLRATLKKYCGIEDASLVAAVEREFFRLAGH